MPDGAGGGAPAFLVRLYDVSRPHQRAGETAEARPGQRAEVADALDLAPDRGAAEQIRLAFASERVRAAVAVSAGRMVACCLWDATGQGTLGPLFAAPGAGTEVTAHILRVACHMMLRVGYWYARGDPSLGDSRELVPEAAVPIPSSLSSMSSRQRDTAAPWTDLYLQLHEELRTDACDQFPLGEQTAYVRRPSQASRDTLTQWVATEFGQRWASEVGAAFGQQPVSVLFATRSTLSELNDVLGFMAYGVSARGMTGPTGLCRSARGTRTAGVLLDRVLRELYSDGFRYAILGGISRRRGVLGALPEAWAIPGSYPALFPVKAGQAGAVNGSVRQAAVGTGERPAR